MRLTGKIVLITGGSLGIGKAIAERFVAEGAKVAISGRSLQDLTETAEAIRQQVEKRGRVEGKVGSLGVNAGVGATGVGVAGEILPIVSDVQHRDQVESLFNAIETQWGTPDIVVNNAGICEMATFLDITEEAWDRHMNINLKGTFLVGQTFAKRLLKHGKAGSIINMSSVNGISAEANQAHYNASKGGINLLTMSMAVELAKYDIRVNAICPGFIATRLTQAAIDDPQEIGEYLKTIPMNRVGQPEEIAGTAVFLASDDSRYMTGHCLVVDGGQVIKLA